MNLIDYDMQPQIQTEYTQRGSHMTTVFENNNVAYPRAGESAQHIKFRAQRLFSIGTDWYFSTREGIDQGPFESKEVAHAAIVKFIRELPLK